MKLQDWELKLLETVKRFMTLRVKSDKEYASLLLNISQQVDKHDNSSQIHYVSTVSKVMAHSCIMGRQVELMFYVFYMFRTIHSGTCSLCFCLVFSISVNLFVCFSHTFLILSFVSFVCGFCYQSWTHMVQQTEQLSKIMKCHAEELNSGPLHRLTLMIKDKQQVKKSYQSLHQQIEFEMHKVSLYIDSEHISGPVYSWYKTCFH